MSTDQNHRESHNAPPDTFCVHGNYPSRCQLCSEGTDGGTDDSGQEQEEDSRLAELRARVKASARASVAHLIQRGIIERTPESLWRARERLLVKVDERVRSIEEYRETLEATELGAEQEPEFFLRAFEGSGTAEKLRLLDERGMLERLIPEFAANRDLTQDVRFHGDETVGEHLFATVDIADDLIDMLPPLSSGKHETMLRLTALFHDIGKNVNPEKDPRVAGKEGLGYRVATRRKGEDFDRVRFLGHAKTSEDIFRNRVGEIQAAAPEQLRFSEAETHMGALWVRHHMRAVDSTRDLKKNSPDQLADRIVRDAYPTQLLNARIPIRDAIRGAMSLQHAELFSMKPSVERSQLEKGWQEIKKEVEARLPVIERQNKELLTVPLVSGTDLEKIGVDPQRRAAILEEIFNRQVDGEIADRRTALETAFELLNANKEKIELLDELLGEGASRSFTARMENLHAKPPEQRDGYQVLRFESMPIQQFTGDTPSEEIVDMAMNGNYPRLAQHIRDNDVAPEQLKTLFTERGFANLLQLEGFLERHGVEAYGPEGEALLDVGTVHSPVMTAVEVRREAPSGEKDWLVVDNGYQGTREHRGTGLIHIGEQRAKALNASFRKPGESEEEMLDRFFEEGVIHVAGTRQLELPSDYDTERFSVLIGPMKNSDRQFVSLIVDKSGLEPRVITSLFQENPKNFRGDLRNMLRRLKERAKLPPEQLQRHIDEVNALLERQDISPITTDQLERKPEVQQQGKRKKKKKPKPEGGVQGGDIAAAGFQGREIGQIMSVLRKRLGNRKVDSAMTRQAAAEAKEKFDAGELAIDEVAQFMVDRLGGDSGA
ncbi:hypothetical protein ACFL26_01185 [Patescibacteria group bacterium]